MAEPHDLIALGMIHLIQQTLPDLPVARSTTTSNTWEELERLQPDLIVLSLKLHDEEGSPLTPRILARYPNMRLVLTSDSADREEICLSIQGNSASFCHVNATQEAFLLAIRETLAGRRYLCEIVIDALTARLSGNNEARLSPRELELLRLISTGHTIKESASCLGLSEKTLYAHRARLLAKTECHDDVALTRYAIKKRLVTL